VPTVEEDEHGFSARCAILLHGDSHLFESPFELGRGREPGSARRIGEATLRVCIQKRQEDCVSVRAAEKGVHPHRVASA
jgi:hypothetical protein